MALTPLFGRNLGSTLWDPMGGFDPFDQFSALSDFPRGFTSDARAIAGTNVDWCETEKEHLIKADLPGLKKEDIKVQIEDPRTLCISGERLKEDVKDTDTWHRVERSRGKFLRRFRLPDNANIDEVKANVEHGVLTVTIPKQEQKQRQARAIDIK